MLRALLVITLILRPRVRRVRLVYDPLGAERRGLMRRRVLQRIVQTALGLALRAVLQRAAHVLGEQREDDSRPVEALGVLGLQRAAVGPTLVRGSGFGDLQRPVRVGLGVGDEQMPALDLVTRQMGSSALVGRVHLGVGQTEGHVVRADRATPPGHAVQVVHRPEVWDGEPEAIYSNVR